MRFVATHTANNDLERLNKWLERNGLVISDTDQQGAVVVYQITPKNLNKVNSRELEE